MFKLYYLRFFLRNFFLCSKLKRIPTRVFGDFILRPIKRVDLYKMFDIYKSMHGYELSFEKKLLYFVFCTKLIPSLYTSEKKMIGFEFYYFNLRDIKEGTIHQGQRYIQENYRGKHLGTALTKYVIDAFALSTFIRGISSRVSLNNKASLHSNLNLGFEPVEQYFDKQMNEERFYLIKKIR